SVAAPTMDLVVPTPSGCEGALSRIKGQLSRNTARRRNHIDLLVAIILSGKSDPLSVWGKLAKHFDARMRREADGCATGTGCRPQVATVGEHHFVATDVRKT